MHDGLFCHTTLDLTMVPQKHPLGAIREILNTALHEMDGTFAAMYADSGRDSIPPEQLLRGAAGALWDSQRATAV